MFKKALRLLLSMMLVVTSLVATVVSVSAAGDTYLVAGSEDLTGYECVTVSFNYTRKSIINITANLWIFK